MTESALLRDVLHNEWDYDGLVMSDWFATRPTATSANAALDLVMPGPDGPWGAALCCRGRRRWPPSCSPGFPGQEFGNALADVLLGRAEPGGRLPTTWPRSESGLPSPRPRNGLHPYDEGLFIGYRGYDRDGRNPRYPFGHGLGFSSWRYLSIHAPEETEPDADVQVTIVLRNLGTRHSKEIVQVYASRPGSAVERPVRWLVGFTAVAADAGEDVTAAITVRARALEHWNAEAGRWELEPGTFQLFVGSSSAALPVTAEITAIPDSLGPAL